MKGLKLSPVVFMIVYSITYGFVFFMDWPLFRYYPLHSDFNWGSHMQKGIGPAMTWYGLVADAFIAAFAVSCVVPDRAMTEVVKRYVWIFPVTAMLLSVYLLRIFLF